MQRQKYQILPQHPNLHKKYTKEEKPHDKTTSNKLREVDLHYYCNIQLSTRLLYTYTP